MVMRLVAIRELRVRVIGSLRRVVDRRGRVEECGGTSNLRRDVGPTSRRERSRMDDRSTVVVSAGRRGLARALQESDRSENRGSMENWLWGRRWDGRSPGDADSESEAGSDER